MINASPPRSFAPLANTPLAKGLVIAGHWGAGVRDVGDGRAWAESGSPTVGHSQGGPGWQFNGTSSYLTRTDAKIVTNNKYFSMAVVCTPTVALATGRTIFAFGNSGSPDPVYAIRTGNATAANAELFARDAGGAGIITLQIASNFAVGRKSVLVVVVNGTSSSFYTEAGSVSGTTPANAVVTDRTGIGALVRNTVGGYFNGIVPMWAAWDRPLSRDEVQSFIVNPWQIFAVPSRSSTDLIRAAYVPSGGGANQILAGRRFSLAGASGLAG